MARLGIRQLVRGLDLGLLTVTIVLVLFGLAALYSFSINIDRPDYTLLTRQAVYAAVGLGMALVLMRIDYRLWGGLHWLLYGLGVAMLVAVLVFGQTIRGTTGWFEFGFVQFQPVEMVKLILVITLAKYIADHLHQPPLRLIFATGMITAVPVMLVMAQPDFGSAMILLGLWLAYLFLARIPKRHFAWLGLGLVAIAVVAWVGVFQEYQKERVLNVLSPSRDPLGTGYNVRQSITAIGAGQIFGRGLGLGTQSQLNFLPERQTDFIFASIAEEFGLLGSLVVVGLFGLLFWRLARLIRRVRDPYSFFLAVGLCVTLFFQTAINILMNLGLFPVTGLPLPFLSYGGSSLLASLLIIGLFESMVIRQRTQPL